MLIYFHETVSELKRLNEYAQRLQQKFEQGREAEDLLLDAESLDERLRDVIERLPDPEFSGNARRHLWWMTKELKKGNVSACKNDIHDLVINDIPGTIAALEKWAKELSFLDEALRVSVVRLIRDRQFDSAIRKAFLLLTERLRTTYSLPADKDGEELVNLIFGRATGFHASLDDSKRQAYRNLMSGLYGVIRNKFAHGDHEPSLAELELDTTRPIFGTIPACRRIARSIFLGSAPDAGIVGGAKHHRGLELERLMLGCAQPGQVIGHYKDAVRAIVDKLQYLNSANNRFWFDTRPNLRREMEDRKRRFNDKEDVFPFIREKLRFAQGFFGGVHVFTGSADVPDDWSLRLVVLAPDAAFSRSGQGTSPASALDRALDILKNRGEQPRQKQNRLIFLAADADSVSRLKDQVRSVLAWQSIVSDVKEGRLNLDMLQGKQASKSSEDAKDALERMVREAYKWLLVPMQEARAGKGVSDISWEHFQINPATVNRMQEIEQVLKDNELLITDWAPIHLANHCKTWFWKDEAPEVKALDFWQKSCSYLYLPRLRDDNVLRNTLAAGASSRDFFGFAYGKDGERYVGFQYGKATSPILDDALLLIEPAAAAAFDKILHDEEVARQAATASTTVSSGLGSAPASNGSGSSSTSYTTGGQSTQGAVNEPPPKAAKKTLFFGAVELNPNQPKAQFSDVVDEIVMLLNRSGVRLKISVEIEAELSDGFDENIQRAVRENCNQLKFKNGAFED